MKIQKVNAAEILDSRGNPTLKAYITLEDGSIHSSSVPSGASTGKYEAVELRDGDAQRYAGKGILQAVKNVDITFNDVLHGMEVGDTEAIDKKMIETDGTPNKSRLGANSMLAVSLAMNRAAAYSENLQLWKFINRKYMNGRSVAFPGVFANVINGGKHAGWNFDIQEFILAVKRDSISESVRAAAELFHALGAHLSGKGFPTLVGDEGGYSPGLSSNGEVFETIIEAAKDLPYVFGTDWRISLDVAASEFYKDGNYMMMKDHKTVSPQELMDTYVGFVEKYNLFSVEDPFDQDDWEHFTAFTARVKGKTFVVGDDFLVTNPERIRRAIEENAASAGLIKLNQIGTVTETIEAIKLCQQAGWQVIVSHRSGETEDAFIADLAYAVGADWIKTGSMSRSERLAKYNRLMEIEKFEA
jgi:enolase